MKQLLLLGLILCGCDDKPAAAPPQQAPSKEVALPPRRIKDEVVAPCGGYTPNGGAAIRDLQVGQGCWIEPWTMWATAGGKYYINATHNFYTDRAKGRIWIERRPDGFFVWLAETTFQWSKINLSDHNFGDQGVPVVEIKE